jgi:hypothetical protein
MYQAFGLSPGDGNEEYAGGHIEDEVTNPEDQDEDNPTAQAAAFVVTHATYLSLEKTLMKHVWRG